MKKKLRLTSLLTLVITTMTLAQVDDVNFILSPKAGYDWFDTKSTLENGALYGFEAGFGFGKVFELRGIYSQSGDLNQDFSAYQNLIPVLSNTNNFSFPQYKATVIRTGGELKANIPLGQFSPYLSLGAGIQTYKRKIPEEEDRKTKNIYAAFGLGLKINIIRRITLDLGGKVFAYNMNPANMLYDPNGSPIYNDWVNSQDKHHMYNWQVGAGLSFYLGGTNREKLTPMERAYLRRFSDKLSGFKITLAPAGSYVNFNKNAGFKDTYMIGGILGIDFSDYFGIQGYYFQSTKDEKISLDFDKLAMYGVDFVGKLNIPRGIVPFVSIGGGYLDVQNGYQGAFYEANPSQNAQNVKSAYYVKGGLGLEIPVSTYFSLFGSANLLYTKADNATDVADLSSTDQLQEHAMYTVGLRFRIGKKAKTEKARKNAFEKEFAPERQAYRNRINELKKELEKAFKQNDTTKVKKIIQEKKQLEKEMITARREARENQILAANYKQKADSLKNELMKAYQHDDVAKIQKIMAEKQALDTTAKNDSSTLQPTPVKTKKKGKEMVRLTPDELQHLINKTIDRVVTEEDSTSIKNRLDHIEQLLLQMKKEQKKPDTSAAKKPASLPRTSTSIKPTEAMPKKATSVEGGNRQQAGKASKEAKANETVKKELQAKIEKLNKRLDQQDHRLQQLQEQPTPQKAPKRNGKRDINILYGGNAPTTVNRNTGEGKRIYNSGLSAFVGYGFGDAETVNVGIRGNYRFSSTSLILMPEFYVGLGDKTGLGMSINGVFPFTIKGAPHIKPYAGLGLGVNYLADHFTLDPNFIVGLPYRIGNAGSIFIDYTVRGNFRYNQLALGYRFSF